MENKICVCRNDDCEGYAQQQKDIANIILDLYKDLSNNKDKETILKKPESSKDDHE